MGPEATEVEKDHTMTQTVYITGTLPGLNEIIAASKVRRGTWSKYLDMKGDYGAICRDAILQAKLNTVGNPVRITCVWYEKNKRRDPDNIRTGFKFIGDALVQMGILANDGWAQILSIEDRFVVDRAFRGVVVTMTETDAGLSCPRKRPVYSIGKRVTILRGSCGMANGPARSSHQRP